MYIILKGERIMNKRVSQEMIKNSVALQVILCITFVLTLFAEIVAVKDLVAYLGDGKIVEDSIRIVITNLFYLLIQIIALQTFRTIAKRETPFLPVVSRNIKVIGALLMTTNPIAYWVSGFLFFITNEHAKLTIANNQILFGLILGLVFSCLGYIFDYGCQLQVSDDETL